MNVTNDVLYNKQSIALGGILVKGSCNGMASGLEIRPVLVGFISF
jgi:hypothetical protein